MNVYDKVHDLARALKECNEVKNLKAVSEKVKDNETNKKMLDDFRKIQFEAYAQQAQKGELSESTKQKLDNMASAISLNPTIAEYLQAEAVFGTMWNDILKILNDAIDINFDFDMK